MLQPSDQRIWILDGPTGTELERRGFSLNSPLWSASAVNDAAGPLLSIHRDYVQAGADILTANTFRTNPATIAQHGSRSENAEFLTRRAVEIARYASAGSAVFVAGAVAPVGDCYRPGDLRSGDQLRVDHQCHIENLIKAGCDLLLLETMSSLSETLIAANIALGSDRPVLVSFVVDQSGGRLLDGTELSHAVESLDRLESENLRGILLNCSSPESTRRGVEILAVAHRKKRGIWEFGGYPNSGEPDPELGWEQVRSVSDDDFDLEIDRMLAVGARFVGSCCGTTPATTARIRRILNDRRT